MNIAVFRGTTLRIHPLFPLMLLLYCIAGQGTLIIAYLLALFLHECGHYCVASRLHLPISLIEFTPLGGAMQIDLADGLRGIKAFGLAAAGILVNALCLLFCFLMLISGIFSPFLSFFMAANAAMLAVNLLPVLPLDGGRMLLAILSRYFNRSRIFHILLLLGRMLAIALLLSSLWLALRASWRPLYALLGCYLLYACALEEKHSVSRYLSSFFVRRAKLEAGEILPLQCLCVSPNAVLYHILPQMQPRAYHLVFVIDEDAYSLRGTISEDHLLKAAVNTPFICMNELLTQK